MKIVEKIKLNPNATIKDALQIIDSGSMKIALVLDKNNKLLGTVSDGDIRRALLNGLTITDPISTIIHNDPIVCNVTDSKETILKIALEKKIYQIPIVDSNGALIGISEIDELLLPTEHNNKVVLMVGGLGSRLRPLTDNTPKPLLEVGNKPILEIIISNFAKCGFKKIILCVNYKSKMIEDYFGTGEYLGVEIQYVHETKRMGTAGGLSLLKEELNDPFFVKNGDLLTNINFEHMLNYHIENKSIATIGVKEYDFQVPYGVVQMQEQRVMKIVEKPMHKFFISTGIYILNSQALEIIPCDTFYDMPSLFEALLSQNKVVSSFPIREYWMDIGRISDYEQANDEYSNYFKESE